MEFLQRHGDGDVNNIENREAAGRLLEHWDRNGGPRWLFLGPEINDFNLENIGADLIEPQRAWELRVAENDPRAPMLITDWAGMRNLRGLFLYDLYSKHYVVLCKGR